MNTSKSILLVEDNQHDVYAIERYLKQSESHGVCSFEHAADFDEVQTILAQKEIDIILSDWHLDDYTADKLITYLREHGIDLPIILLTSRHDVNLEKIADDLDVDFFLNKFELSAKSLSRAIRYCERKRNLSISELNRSLNSFLGSTPTFLSQIEDEFRDRFKHNMSAPIRLLQASHDTLSVECQSILAKHILSIQNKAIERLEKMVADLTSFFEPIEEGTPVALDIEKVIKSVFKDSMQGAMSNIVNIDIQCDVNQLVFFNENHIKKIVSEVVGNAIKNTPNGKIIISATIIQQDNGREALQLSVIDNGRGIKSKSLPFLCKPAFTEASDIEQKQDAAFYSYSGIGIGLAIVKRLVDTLNGKLQIHSEARIGTIINITLPLTFDKTGNMIH